MKQGAAGNLIDIHAHILPGLDDGSHDLKETQLMLIEAKKQGIRQIIATPHYIGKRYQPEPDQIFELVRLVQREADQCAPGLKIYPGEEILYFSEMEEALSGQKLLTLNGTRYILVEFLPSVAYSRLVQALRKLVWAGYFPVLAHVERYSCLRRSGRLEEIRKAGIYIQMNFTSLRMNFASLLGPIRLLAGQNEILSEENHLADRLWCRKMLLEDQVQFLGTDMHGSGYRPPECSEAVDWIRKKLGEDYLNCLTEQNPQKLLSGEPI